jgi:hypothetical protein
MIMDWTEALENVVASTGHVRYRELCRDDYPDYREARALMVRLAGGELMTAHPDWPVWLWLPRVELRGFHEAPAGEQGCGCGRA